MQYTPFLLMFLFVGIAFLGSVPALSHFLQIIGLFL